MRFSVELLLENDRIPKDKNRIILSIMKSCFSSFSEQYYKERYELNKNLIKEFTFSLYMGNCKFLREEILIPDKKIYLNFSAYKIEDGIMFYNSFLNKKGKEYSVKNNMIKIGKIVMKKEKTIFNDEAIFKAMSPIVVREHNGDNKKTWYHSLSSKKGQDFFINNLKKQLKNVFGERVVDFEDIFIEVSKNNKEVKVKNYEIEVLANITKIKIKAKPYILEYLYKAGIGSKRGSGFGMVEIV
ncbi:CRISPR-associated endoribonuclease Cas6 [Wukongibacter sp. M2B1]|uniref:CRISPR-associated endoribonuclease Cas6 n=1 Tax=Wukongibacter sp. M2B1 TaxID=3088895 RepID=UPI003D7BC75F